MKEYTLPIVFVVLAIAIGLFATNTRIAKAPTAKGSVTVEMHIGETIRALGVSLTPLAVREDSRCPTDVVCIQAGTVRVELRTESELGIDTRTISLGEFFTTETEKITFITVLPIARSDRTISDEQYRFRFLVEKHDVTSPEAQDR